MFIAVQQAHLIAPALQLYMYAPMLNYGNRRDILKYILQCVVSDCCGGVYKASTSSVTLVARLVERRS